ncbi:MAG TPA: hypothetical protein VG371_12595 [Solirubrobacteraceae bacterium]|jgi:hypothetical protein|nr:hypothetical protein [Solirubrobacteraceae bacterium]
METPEKPTPQQEPEERYEHPTLSDYGTLVDLTAAAGHLTNSDLPHGLPNTAYLPS